MARAYNMRSRMEKAYSNYVKLYRQKEASLERRGFNMAAPLLDRDAYEMLRDTLVRNGLKININKTIVSKEAYTRTLLSAKKLKEAGKKYDTSWKDLSIAQIRANVMADDISDFIVEFDKQLKEQYPGITGKQRAQYISYEVFGSE